MRMRQVFSYRHKVGITAGKTMLFHVKAGDFFLRRYTQADNFIQQFEDNGHGDEYIRCNSNDACQLCYKQGAGTGVEQAAFFGKETDADSAESAADAVYGDGADRVVDFKLLVKKFYGHNNQNACKGTNAEGSGNTYHIAAGSNAYQTGKRAVKRHGNIRFAIACPGVEHGSGSTGGCRHISGNKNLGHGHQSSIAGSTDSGAAVETEPAEP